VIDGEGALLGAEALRRLATQGGVQIEPGLTEDEFAAVEQRFGFEFADDHRGFLAAGLPVGPWWPDWRNRDEANLSEWLAWPVDGVLFDVRNNEYWYGDWGQRPTSKAQAVALAQEHLATVPRMVPVYSHRYLPAGRGRSAHPVLSMYQTDIIYYGVDLVDYVHQEFGAGPGIKRDDPRWEPAATVPFWNDLVE
jgi:hypothetical protein